MYSVCGIYFLLFGQESIFGGVAHRQQTGELVAFGSVHDFLNLLGFVAYGNMEHRSQTFGGGRKQHVLQRAPCRSKIVERALLYRFEQRPCQLAEKRNDKQVALLFLFYN